MKWTILFGTIVLAYLGSSAAGRTIYVDDDGPADLSNIQAAINHAEMAVNESSSDTPMIEIYPAELSFTHNIGDYNPTAQKAWIRNSGTGTLFWEITKDCNWVDFWPGSGESIGQEKGVVVTVDATGLFGGEYNCTLTISDANAANSPGYLPVTLLVRPPHIGVTPIVLSFVCPEGGASLEPQILSVWNANVGKLNWEITEDCNWLTVQPASGQSTGETDQVTISADSNGLGHGEYSCFLTVSDEYAQNSPQYVTVNLDVRAPLIGVSSNLLEFAAQEDGPNPESQTLSISNAADVGVLHWELAEDCDWLEADAVQGAVSDQDSNEVLLSVDVTGLTQGTYQCNITVVSSYALNSPQTVTVLFHVSGEVVYVPDELATIQDAIDHVTEGGTVIVGPRSYTGEGNRDIDFRGKVITVRSVDPNDPAVVANTIIDCNGSAGDYHRGFYFHSEEGNDSVLTGFTIINGFADYGAGIRCTAGSNPTITNCVITGCSAVRDGAGVYLAGVVGNCKVTDNHAGRDGGGLNWCRQVYGCVITGNTAVRYGAGMFWCRSVSSCIISGNSAGIDGGGAYYCSVLTGCTIAANVAETGSGGGVFGEYGEVTNCILWANTAASGSVEEQQVRTLSSLSFCCIQDDNPDDSNIPFGGLDSNNIDDNPVFVRDPWDGGDGWGDDPATGAVDEGANDDFGDLHVAGGSPCIDSGSNLMGLRGVDLDVDRQPRMMGPAIDMGADEFLIATTIVTKPEGGETWVAGSRHEVLWYSAAFKGMAEVMFSADAGERWQVIESVPVEAGSYMCAMPDLADSNECLIKVVPIFPQRSEYLAESGFFTVHPDSPGAAVESGWKSLGGDYERRGLSEYAGPEYGCIEWEFETDGAISGGVTIGPNESIYVPCEDGNLYCLDSSGALLWTFEAGAPLISAASIAPDGTAYVGGADGKLRAVNRNGGLRWTYRTDGFICSSPAAGPDGRIFVGSEDGRLYALAPDGSELWSFETAGFGVTEGAVLASPAIGPDGTVYVGGLYDSNLYALEPNDGAAKWVCHFDSNGWCYSSPVVGPDGTIYQTLLEDANLYAIDPNDGCIMWKTNLSNVECWNRRRYYSRWFTPYQYYRLMHPCEIYVFTETDSCEYLYDDPLYNLGDSSWSEPVLGADGTIYINLDDPWLRAIEPSGAMKWATELGYGGGLTGDCNAPFYPTCRDPSIEGALNLTVGSDGLICAAGNDSNLYVIHPDGYELARFESGESWLRSAVLSGEGTVLVADERDRSFLLNGEKNRVWAVSSRGCDTGQPAMYWHRGREDLNNDGVIDWGDMEVIAEDWLECTDCDVLDCESLRRTKLARPYYGDINKDRYVDFADLAVLAQRWLAGN